MYWSINLFIPELNNLLSCDLIDYNYTINNTSVIKASKLIGIYSYNYKT